MSRALDIGELRAASKLISDHLPCGQHKKANTKINTSTRTRAHSHRGKVARKQSNTSNLLIDSRSKLLNASAPVHRPPRYATRPLIGFRSPLNNPDERILATGLREHEV